jgi:hypothetical protein
VKVVVIVALAALVLPLLSFVYPWLVSYGVMD